MVESPVQGVLKVTLQAIAERILKGSGGDISLVCPRLANGVYRIEAHAGGFPPEVHIPDVDYRAGSPGAGGQVAATGEPRLIDDYWEQIPDSPFINQIKTIGARSIVNAAAGPKGDVIAVLYVMSRTPGFFKPSDMERLQGQADIAEIAIRLALTA